MTMSPDATHDDALVETDRAGTTKRWLRRGALVLGLIGLFVVAERTGLRDALSGDGLRELVEQAGPFGVFAYLGAFCVGLLAQVPGMAFVLAARAAYGPVVGFLVAYAGALMAVSASFVVVRAVGGKAAGKVKSAWAQRALARLDDRPIQTVVLLRTVLALSPPLNYALAMSRTRFRDYFVGSALGLVAPVAAWVFLSDMVMQGLACVS
ncbi:MAG: TVP38/TMEM64 family protein [Sandaracinaceae bacterium]